MKRACNVGIIGVGLRGTNYLRTFKSVNANGASYIKECVDYGAIVEVLQ